MDQVDVPLMREKRYDLASEFTLARPLRRPIGELVSSTVPFVRHGSKADRRLEYPQWRKADLPV